MPRVGAESRALRARQAHAIDADAHVFRIETADAHSARVGLVVVNHDAGHVFDELADVAVGDVAEGIGGDDVLHVECGALVHDGLGVAFAFRGNDKLRELDDVLTAGGRRCGTAGFEAGGREFEIARGRGAGRNGEARRRGVVARVGHAELALAWRNSHEHKISIVSGEGGEIGTGDGDLDVAQIFTCGGAEHAALNLAGGGLGKAGGGEDRRKQSGGETATQPDTTKRTKREQAWEIHGAKFHRSETAGREATWGVHERITPGIGLPRREWHHAFVRPFVFVPGASPTSSEVCPVRLFLPEAAALSGRALLGRRARRWTRRRAANYADTRVKDVARVGSPHPIDPLSNPLRRKSIERCRQMKIE